MNIFVYIYIILYILYIILGPHFISRLFRRDQIKIVSSYNELLRRMFFLSYIGLLTNAFYFYKQDINSLIITILVNLYVLIGFIIKWFHIRNTDPYYYIGIVSHILIFIPILISVFYLNLNIKINKFSIIITIFLLFLYTFIQNNIYID